jgi:hypothetical protein
MNMDYSEKAIAIEDMLESMKRNKQSQNDIIKVKCPVTF